MAEEQTDNPKDDKIPYDMYTFREWATGIQQQIDQMEEKVSNAYAAAQTAKMLANTNEEAISKLWRAHDENTTPSREQPPKPPQLPDSNGFWSDKDGDIWSYDGDPDNPPRFIFSTALQEVCETPTDSTTTFEAIEDYAPFTKISNPFTTGDNHDDR